MHIYLYYHAIMVAFLPIFFKCVAHFLYCIDLPTKKLGVDQTML